MSTDIENHLNGLKRRRFDFEEQRFERNLLRLDAMKNQLDKINELLHEYVSQAKEDKLKRQDKNYLLN